MPCHGVYPIVEDQTTTDLTLLATSPPRAQLCLGARHSVAAPTTAATTPPMSIQMALSVGDPVKNLETSELKEWVALTPMMMSTMPPTSRARGTILFMNDLNFFKLVNSFCEHRFAFLVRCLVKLFCARQRG